MWMLATNLITRGIIDVGIGVGAAAAIALGAYRVTHGMMSLQALLIVLMAGTEIFRPLRDFRTVLHDGMVGQAAAIGINALLQAQAPMPQGGARPPAPLAPAIAFDDVHFSYPGGRGAALGGLSLRRQGRRAHRHRRPERQRQVDRSRALLLRLYDPQSGSVRIGGADLHVARSGRGAGADRRGAAGYLSVPRHRRGQSAPRQAGRDAGAARRRGARRQRA